MLAIGAPTGGGLGGGGEGLDGGVGTLPVVGGSGAAAACDVRCARARGDDPRVLHEREIAGPAVKPTMAPATAPTGPSTTAPDTAPIAASAARSCARASNETSEPAISNATGTIRMANPLTPIHAAQGNKKMRRHKGLLCVLLRQGKGPRPDFGRGPSGIFDAINLKVICPACQFRIVHRTKPWIK